MENTTHRQSGRRASLHAPALIVSILGFSLAVLVIDASAADVSWWRAEQEPPNHAMDLAQVETLQEESRALLRQQEFWRAAWNAYRVKSATQAALSGYVDDELERQSWEAVAKQTQSHLNKSIKELTPGEVACLAAWWGVDPRLSLQYAKAIADIGWRTDAAAEALAFLAENPNHKSASGFTGILRRADEPIRFAGGAHQSVFRVAALVPLSGSYESYGNSLFSGLILGIEEENAKGPLPMRVVAYDTKGQGWTAAQQAELAFQQGAGVFVGAALSIPTLAVAGVAQAKGIPLFSPAATEERISDVGAFVFQTGLSELEQGRALARYAMESLRVTRIAVTLDDGEALGNLAAGFWAQAEDWKAGDWDAELFTVQAPSGARDFHAAVNQLRRDSVDALLLPTDQDKAQLWAAALRAEKYTVRILGSELLDPSNLHSESRSDFEGIVMAGLEYAFPDYTFGALDTLTQTRFGHPADSFVRRGYLTARILGRAIRAGVASPKLMVESVSQRLVDPADEGHPGRNFVRWAEHDALVPIYTWQRGSSVRLR